MDNQTSVSIKFNNKVTGEKKLEKYAQTLQQINGVLNAIDTGKAKQIDAQIKDVGKETNTMAKNFNTSFNIGKFTFLTRVFENLITKMSKFTKKSADFTENWNLLDVAFSGATKDAEKFVNTMTEMYGLDESWGYRTIGLFKQLSNAMGITDEIGTDLSKTLTQLSVDLSSLYNVEVEDAVSKLQSALAGQTKPVRFFGADITQNTLQLTLETHGVDKAITDLSYAEKRLLIVASILEQTQEAQGDWGRTIESTANQMRIMQQQVERLTRALGNVFMPVLKSLLPVMNGVLMALTEIISMLAIFVGYEQEDFFTGVDDSVSNLIDDLDKANESAKKLRSGLRGFDKLNNITTSQGSGTGSGTGIDQAIIDLYKNASSTYLSSLDEINMKATKIRDNIMAWLGFTKEINPLTGDISFKYEGIKTTLKNMYDWFRKLNPVSKILVALIAKMITSSTIKLFTNFGKLIGKTGIYKSISSLLSPVKTLGKYFSDDLAGGIYGLDKALGNSIDMWSKNLTAMDRFKVSLVGAGGLLLSLNLIDDAMSSVAEEGWNMKNGLEAGLGVLGTIGSGALIGSQFGAIGTAVGGAVGAIIALYDAYMEYPTKVSIVTAEIAKANEQIMNYNKNLQDQYDAIKQSEIANLSLQTSYSNLVSELETITDENGRVKDGYEDRAKFILTTLNQAYGLELEMIDGVIQKYQEQIQSIKDVILEKKKEIALESAEQAFKVAMQEKAETYKNYTLAVEKNAEAIQNQKNAQDEYNKAYEEWSVLTAGGLKLNWYADARLKKAREQLEKMNTELENSKTALDGATKAYDNNTNAILIYQGLLTADTKDNAELVEKYINEIENSYYDGSQFIKLTYDEQVEDALNYYNSVLRITKLNEEEITDEVLAEANARLNTLKTNLTDMTNALDGELGDSLIEAWRELANTSEEKFIQEFGKLDEDIQQQVVNKMYEKGYGISEELQKGIEGINPTIKVKTDLSGANKTIKITADTSSAEKTTSSFWDKLKNAFFKSFGLNIGTLKFANGGLPPVGQLFVANEKGPELVGQIGGQSFVANQNQMMDLLDKKIGGSSNPMNATFIIQVGGEEVAKTVLKDLQEMAKSNGEPITIE